MLSASRSAPSTAPPAAASASATREPGCSRTNPERVTSPTTLTTSSASAVGTESTVPSVSELSVATTARGGAGAGLGASLATANPATSTTKTPAAAIASAPADESQLEFLIRHVPGGLASEWVATQASPGDAVKVQGPLGAFARDDRAARHVFVVGGTGLAPAGSMRRDLATGEGEEVVCFGGTSLLERFHVDELKALAAAHGRAEARIAVFIGESGPDATQGTAVSLLKAEDVVPDTAYYLCGPPAMVESARTTLAVLGAPLSAIRAERYLPSA
mgnify:CR=1 FL=1